MYFLESSDESRSSSDSDGEEYQIVEWTPTGPGHALGDWEKYTTVSTSMPVGRVTVHLSIIVAQKEMFHKSSVSLQ